MDIPFQIAEPKALLLFTMTIPVVIFLGMLSGRARPRDRGRINASIVVRSLILALLTLALGGLQWVSASQKLNVIFLIDKSASISQQTQDAALQYVRSALKSMVPDDRAGIILFGERAVVARALSGDKDLAPFGDKPSITATNIADAIQSGLALFPEGGARRLVLLSDGAQTVGEAQTRHGLLARGYGVQLSVVPLGTLSQNEVAVDRVVSPNSIPLGQQFDVQAVLRTTSDHVATVDLLDNNKLVASKQATLKWEITRYPSLCSQTQKGSMYFHRTCHRDG